MSIYKKKTLHFKIFSSASLRCEVDVGHHVGSQPVSHPDLEHQNKIQRGEFMLSQLSTVPQGEDKQNRKFTAQEGGSCLQETTTQTAQSIRIKN